MTYRTFLAFCSMILLSISLIAESVIAQAPPKQLSVELGPNVAVEMVLIPAGRISKGRPEPQSNATPPPAEGDLAALSRFADIPAFYISISEVTFAQLVAILPAARMAVIQDRIEKTTGKDPSNQYLRDAIRSSDLPAFSLSFDEVLAFCKALNDHNEQLIESNATSIETRRFRVPYHLEWQYACRAGEDLTAEATLPHINRWVDLDAMQKDARELIREEWQKLGKPPNELNGSQFQIFELLDARLAQSDSLGAPQRILSEYFRAALGINRDFAAATGRLRPIKLTTANAWGLYDMHDNVCEWAVKIDSRKDFLEFWDGLQTTNARSSRDCLVLAGGGFAQAANVRGAWKDFSIWGGYPINRDSGELQPMSLDKGLDNSIRSVAAEFSPGLRLVMDRMMRANWFAVVRKAAQRDSAPSNLFEQFRQSAVELATTEEANRIKLLADTYEGLALVRGDQAAEGNPKLQKAFDQLTTFKPAGKSESGSKLDALKQKLASKSSTTSTSAPASKSPAEEDDEIFFKLAGEVVR